MLMLPYIKSINLNAEEIYLEITYLKLIRTYLILKIFQHQCLFLRLVSHYGDN